MGKGRALDRMGQRLARHEMDKGVKLYHDQKHRQAVGRWKTALRKLKAAEDRFITMGYLAQAHCEAGTYEEMLASAMHQIDLANLRDDPYMRAEAYLNLARANEKLCEFHKAISYGRHSIVNQSLDPRTPGYAYLTIAHAYMGFSHYQAALEHLELGMQVSSQTGDKLLELQVCVALGALFTVLRDMDKALVFVRNALQLLKAVSIDDVHAKYRALALHHYAQALRRHGALVDAREAAEESLRLSSENGNAPIQGRCLCTLGDIHRDLGESDKCWSRYNASYTLLKELNDKMGQVAVLGSMAKASTLFPHAESGHCECQAIQLNKRCLDLAKTMGNKMATLKCHSRLQQLYEQLADDESEEIAQKAVTALTQEMELFCNFCGQRFAIRTASLQALPCSHLFHEKCLHDYLRTNSQCPKCQHKATSMSSSLTQPSDDQQPCCSKSLVANALPHTSPSPLTAIFATPSSTPPPQQRRSVLKRARLEADGPLLAHHDTQPQPELVEMTVLQANKTDNPGHSREQASVEGTVEGTAASSYDNVNESSLAALQPTAVVTVTDV